MAIDDNTSYELTGAQVKDLANKIKGKAADNTFVGATSAAPGSKGLVPTPQAGDDAKFLSGDGTWKAAPTVNNGALTIQQNGTTLNTFTANSSDDKTVNIQTITAETVAPAEEVGAITTNMIADGAVTAKKVDWSTIKHSAPTLTVLRTIGTVSSNQSYTAPANGFLIGKGVTLASGGKAGVFLTDSDTYCIGGIPYTDYSGNVQVAFCVPVYKGQTVYLRISGGSSRLEEVKLVASHSEAGI